MSSVTLSGVYLAPVATPADYVVLNAGVTLSGAGGVVGDIRRYAGGRVRLITRAGRTNVLQVAAPRLDRTTRELLDSWAGQLMFLRDGRGRLVHGSYLITSPVEQPGLPTCDISFAFTEITTSVEV